MTPNDDDSRTAAIKPCPLCGGERIKAHYIRDGQTLGCQDCGCSVRAFNPRAGHKNINLWNTRDLADPIQLAAAERRGIERAGEWQDIATAPKDGTVFLAYSQGHDLPPFISTCAWHRDAGFCTDELREPTHWMPLPAPPAIRSLTEG